MRYKDCVLGGLYKDRHGDIFQTIEPPTRWMNGAWWEVRANSISIRGCITYRFYLRDLTPFVEELDSWL